MICEIAACLLSEKVLSPELRERAYALGIDLDALADCLRRRCDQERPLSTGLVVDRVALRKALAPFLDD
jgi:hypothetical protein